jgi:hypothetical protein
MRLRPLGLVPQCARRIHGGGSGGSGGRPTSGRRLPIPPGGWSSGGSRLSFWEMRSRSTSMSVEGFDSSSDLMLRYHPRSIQFSVFTHLDTQLQDP